MDLASEIYRATQDFPKHEQFGLVGQLRRSAISVPINIAEGSGRRTKADFGHFLYMTAGSLKELETLILLSHRLGYLPEYQSLLNLAERVGMMNTKLRQSMVGRTNDQRPTTSDKRK